MVITFVGHRDFIKTNNIEQNLLFLLEAFATKSEELYCYCGGYGNFDHFAARCVKHLQEYHSNIHSCLIIPYLTLKFQEQINIFQEYYDEIIYPPLENTPKKLAIIKRNEWMIDRCDIIISYIRRTWGGAAQTIQYAKQKQRLICSL